MVEGLGFAQPSFSIVDGSRGVEGFRVKGLEIVKIRACYSGHIPKIQGSSQIYACFYPLSKDDPEQGTLNSEPPPQTFSRVAPKP